MKATIGDISVEGTPQEIGALLSAFSEPHQPKRQTRMRRRFTKDEDAQLLRMRREGHTFQSIGDALGRDKYTLAYRFRRLTKRTL